MFSIRSDERLLLRSIVAQQLDPRSGSLAHELAELSMRRGDVVQAAKFINRQTNLAHYRPSDLLAFHRRFPTPFLNIGGGPQFLYPLWANLEAVWSPLNPQPFELDANVSFPSADCSFELVYSSHTLQHLDTPTVENVLREARRVVKSDGALLIKIPDFFALLKAWANDDDRLVSEEDWNFSQVIPTLKNRGLRSSIHTRTAYLFCGFWNREFGNLFDEYNAFAPNAYNGPPALPDAEFASLAKLESPNRISRHLRDHASRTETNISFNHQNAWAHEEFASVLDESGFTLCSTDTEKIVERFNHIPRVEEMRDISAYYLAFPRR